MKKLAFGFTLALLCGVCFAQQARVAVAPFTATSGNAASDAETIAEIFGLELQAKNVVRVYTRGSTLSVMNEHKFQMSDLSSDEKTASIGKAASADWVVRGQVQKLGAVIVVTASLLDVNTLEIMAGAPMYLNAIEEAATKMDGFITTITQRIGSGSGRTAAPGPRTGGNVTGIGIEVSTKTGGVLYFQGEEVTTLWDDDTYTIPVERPGTYTVKMVFGNGTEKTRAVAITTRGVTKVDFSGYSPGDTGPGGGMVVFYNNGRGMEVSGILDSCTWGQAKFVVRNYRGGGYSDWRLPTKDELNIVYQNLRAKNIGNLGDSGHWSSTEWYGKNRTYDGPYFQNFSDGRQYINSGGTSFNSVRAVRAF
jgi:TolB-like protein